MAVQAHNLNIYEAEAEGLPPQVWGQFGLHSEFQAFQHYIVKACLKNLKILKLKPEHRSGSELFLSVPGSSKAEP